MNAMAVGRSKLTAAGPGIVNIHLVYFAEESGLDPHEHGKTSSDNAITPAIFFRVGHQTFTARAIGPAKRRLLLFESHMG